MAAPVPVVYVIICVLSGRKQTLFYNAYAFQIPRFGFSHKKNKHYIILFVFGSIFTKSAGFLYESRSYFLT